VVLVVVGVLPPRSAERKLKGRDEGTELGIVCIGTGVDVPTEVVGKTTLLSLWAASTAAL